MKTDIQVTQLDGTRLTLPLRELSIRELEAMTDALKDDELNVELYTGAAPGTAATLTIASQLEVLERGDAINLENFASWAKRRVRVSGRLNVPVPNPAP